MTRYQPLWQQSGTYPATQDRQLMGALWPGGGVSGGACTTVAATMQVSAAAGTAAVPLTSGQGAALCRWDAAEVTTLANAVHPGTQTRIDLVIVQVRDNALDAGGNNDFIVTNVTGTPATTGSQVAPATPANAMVLAQVTVLGAIANLNAATIVDYRPFALGAMANSVRCQVWRSAAGFAIANTTNVIIQWDTADFDPTGMWNGVGAFTVKIPGIYLVAWQCSLPTGGSGTGAVMQANLYRNGAAAQGANGSIGTTGGPFGGTSGGSRLLPLVVGDTLQTNLYQTSGASLNLSVGRATSFMSAMLLSL
jgi:hypothetical protein